MTGDCPICGKVAAGEARPFCSRRCADIDLGRWLTGAYVVAGADDDGDGEGASEADMLDRSESLE